VGRAGCVLREKAERKVCVRRMLARKRSIAETDKAAKEYRISGAPTSRV
jgi:hypothetical protein